MSQVVTPGGAHSHCRNGGSRSQCLGGSRSPCQRQAGRPGMRQEQTTFRPTRHPIRPPEPTTHPAGRTGLPAARPHRNRLRPPSGGPGCRPPPRTAAVALAPPRTARRGRAAFHRQRPPVLPRRPPATRRRTTGGRVARSAKATTECAQVNRRTLPGLEQETRQRRPTAVPLRRHPRLHQLHRLRTARRRRRSGHGQHRPQNQRPVRAERQFSAAPTRRARRHQT